MNSDVERKTREDREAPADEEKGGNQMARYRCSVCGYIFDEEAEGKKFSELKECPVCHQPADKFYLYEEEKPAAVREKKELKLDYPKEFVRQDDSCRYMKEIHEMAVDGKEHFRSYGNGDPHAGLG